MIWKSTRSCLFCGQNASASPFHFLVAENRWKDALKILRWDDELAGKRGIYCACSPSHVREIAAAWMAGGSLRSFARAGHAWRILDGVCSRWNFDRISWRQSNTTRAPWISEICVDREALTKSVWREKPCSLNPSFHAMLDTLVAALQREMQVVEEHRWREPLPQPSVALPLHAAAHL